MKINRRSVLRYAAALPALPLAGCGILTGISFHFLYKLYVLIDGQEHVGSTIIRVHWYHVPSFLLDAGDGWMQTFKGQAITIPLAGRGIFVGTLGGFWDQNHKLDVNKFGLIRLLPDLDTRLPRRLRDDVGAQLGLLDELDGEHELEKAEWPVVFYFADKRDWQTVALVDGNASTPRWVPNIIISRFTVTVTHDAVSSGIEKELPLIAQVKAFKPDPRSIPSQRPLYQQLKPTQFEVDGNDRMGAT